MTTREVITETEYDKDGSVVSECDCIMVITPNDDGTETKE